MILLCAIPALLSTVLSLVAELLTVIPSATSAAYALAGIVFVLNVIAVPVTHELSGHKMHSGTWHFYQPWRGGVVFILLQFVSWALFVVAMLSALRWIYSMMTSFSAPHGLVASAGLVGFSAEAFMVLSLSTFRADSPSTFEYAFFGVLSVWVYH